MSSKYPSSVVSSALISSLETPSSTDQAPNTAPFSFLPNRYIAIDEVLDVRHGAAHLAAVAGADVGAEAQGAAAALMI